jgi:hypothetical protein
MKQTVNYYKVKVKVKICQCFNWAPRHEGVLGEWRYSSTHSLTLALDGGEWSASRSCRFTPKERAPGIHWKGDWVSPRAILDEEVMRKIPSPCRWESNPRTPIIQPIARRYTDWAILALQSHIFNSNFRVTPSLLQHENLFCFEFCLLYCSQVHFLFLFSPFQMTDMCKIKTYNLVHIFRFCSTIWYVSIWLTGLFPVLIFFTLYDGHI